MPLTSADLARIAQQLGERRTQLLAEINEKRLERQTADDGPLGQELHNESADIELSVELAAADAAEIARDNGEIAAIDLALQRIGDGSYGYCANCDAEIPMARLQVAPAAVRCINCQSLLEQHGTAKRR